MLVLFLFKQKTAYEMRISDWSSDVCSSDLAIIGELLAWRGAGAVIGFFLAMYVGKLDPRIGMSVGFLLLAWSGWMMKIGRASCRERECQYVYISVVAVSLKK